MLEALNGLASNVDERKEARIEMPLLQLRLPVQQKIEICLCMTRESGENGVLGTFACTLYSELCYDGFLYLQTRALHQYSSLTLVACCYFAVTMNTNPVMQEE